jgi:3-oxoacyl-[acyl-carrier protein] reductase
MQPDVKRAFVLGGTGAVGSAVLRELHRRGVTATFTYRRSDDAARALGELGHRAVRCDLADAAATAACLDAQDTPDVVIHCAAISGSQSLVEIDGSAWREMMTVNLESAFAVVRWIAQRGKPCDIVLVGGLDRTQSLPLPVHFATTQGALSALVMSAAHELGPRNVRINMIALGVLDAGLSQGLANRRRADYMAFSALRRVGTCAEAARAIAWLTLDNAFIQGKVVPVTGGI